MELSNVQNVLQYYIENSRLIRKNVIVNQDMLKKVKSVKLIVKPVNLEKMIINVALVQLNVKNVNKPLIHVQPVMKLISEKAQLLLELVNVKMVISMMDLNQLPVLNVQKTVKLVTVKVHVLLVIQTLNSRLNQ